MRVVPALDELEERQAGFGLAVERAAVEQLAFERGEKALAHGVAEAITDRTHRGLHKVALDQVLSSSAAAQRTSHPGLRGEEDCRGNRQFVSAARYRATPPAPAWPRFRAHPHGNAESVAYPDASFDSATSQYGACRWAETQPLGSRGCTPVASARPSGFPNQLVPDEAVHATRARCCRIRLLRPAFGIYRIECPGDRGVEFHLAHGDWILLLTSSG